MSAIDDDSLPHRRGGQRAVVTGAGAGIGRAIAARLAAEGALVLVADVDDGAAARVAAELGATALSHAVDVADEARVAAMIARVIDEWDGIDVLVNNAGVGIAATTPQTSEQEWRRVLGVCLTGTFFGLKHAIPPIPWIDRITASYDDPAAARAAMEARQPHGRFVRPDEIAAVAAYLASDEAASVIGAVTSWTGE